MFAQIRESGFWLAHDGIICELRQRSLNEGVDRERHGERLQEGRDVQAKCDLYSIWTSGEQDELLAYLDRGQPRSQPTMG